MPGLGCEIRKKNNFSNDIFLQEYKVVSSDPDEGKKLVLTEKQRFESRGNSNFLKYRECIRLQLLGISCPGEVKLYSAQSCSTGQNARLRI